MNKKVNYTSNILLGSVLLAGLFGCTVKTSKDQGGKDKDVDIRTPFGSLSVHGGKTDTKDLGLALYPGATVKEGKDDGNDNDANVNISSSLFGLKVIVQKFQSQDAPDKVLGFYEKALSKYGKVVRCNGGMNMGFHHEDQDAPVSCNDDNDNDHEYKTELKVGTQNNQHVVAVKPSGKGSEFVLVYVRAKTNESKDTI
jgi:hypothetical protein